MNLDLGYPLNTRYSMRDVIEHKDLGVYSYDTISFKDVKSHGVKAIILSFENE